VTEILQNIRQADMTPILQRLYQSDGGSEVCDTLMKYLYKGMAQGAPTGSDSRTNATGGKNITPQATGFSQVGGRSFGGAEGAGQGMSVFLSWHEKVGSQHSFWRLVAIVQS
jgi:actin related protein 2/3 complex subunit 5